MDGIGKVMQRISAIEHRFASRSANNSASHGNFEEALRNAEKSTKVQVGNQTIETMIRQTAATYGVDPNLALAVATAESSLDPFAVSPAGAIGVMQLMPDTARSLGVKNIYDVKDNIDGGIRYLKQMLNTFNGDVTKALAAYNAGPDAVRQYQGVPPYRETQEYVNKILGL